METKEIEQRIDDAVNEIPLKEILQDSKNTLKIKLERFEENRKYKRNGISRRIKAAMLQKAKNRQNEILDFGMKCIQVGLLIMLGVLIYQFIIRPLFS